MPTPSNSNVHNETETAYYCNHPIRIEAIVRPRLLIDAHYIQIGSDGKAQLVHCCVVRHKLTCSAWKSIHQTALCHLYYCISRSPSLLTSCPMMLCTHHLPLCSSFEQSYPPRGPVRKAEIGTSETALAPVQTHTALTRANRAPPSNYSVIRRSYGSNPCMSRPSLPPASTPQHVGDTILVSCPLLLATIALYKLDSP